MKVLVSTTAGTGHIGPTLPVADALRRAGHEVHWATAEPECAALARRGFDVHPAGMTVPDRMARFVEAVPGILEVPLRERRAIGYSVNFAVLTGPVMLDALVPIVDAVEPDLIVHEVAELAAAPIATARGIDRIVVAFSGDLPHALVDAATRPAAELWGRFGLEVPADLGLTSTTYLHPFAPSMGHRPPGPDVRDLAPARDVAPEAPPWLETMGHDRPLVYATFGTEYLPSAPWPALIAALASLDADIVVTVGPSGDDSRITSLADGSRGDVRIERFVPQASVLDRASAVVSHGGAGTVLAAAARGIPQVILPMTADQFDNADALAEAGTASVFLPSEVEPGAIGNAIDAALGGANDRAAAVLAAEFAAMPDADAVVRSLGLA